jgi:hypothetical protein
MHECGDRGGAEATCWRALLASCPPLLASFVVSWSIASLCFYCLLRCSLPRSCSTLILPEAEDRPYEPAHVMSSDLLPPTTMIPEKDDGALGTSSGSPDLTSSGGYIAESASDML